jgi:2-methylcitrate dehydratase PrpD
MVDQLNDSIRGLRDLVNWASSLDLSQVPEIVVRRATMILIDDIAAMVAARTEPQVAAVYALARKRSCFEESTLLDGGCSRTARTTAAFANAVAANWCELDEGYRRAACHGGLYSVPAGIAEAESSGAKTGGLLRAIVIGYEIAARFARTWQFPAYPRKVHPHSTFAAVGAAATVAALRELDPFRFFDVVTTAATFSTVGPYSHAVRGALVENTWAAIGALAGFQANDLVDCGITGLQESPFDVFQTVLGASTCSKRLSEELGVQWAVRDGYHKIHACCGYTHATVDVIVGLHDQLRLRRVPDEIDEILVETHALALNLDTSSPGTTLGARFSLPHIAAATIMYGHAGPEAFSTSTLRDSRIAALREKVKLSRLEPSMPSPNDRPSRVTIIFRDGEVVVGECLSARGGPDRPWSQEVILEKVSRLTREAYPSFADGARKLLNSDCSTLGHPWAQTLTDLLGVNDT